ncbi:MAG: carboxypeptidase regulatory-like domain-containing protein [Planctomycetes bacterium]|nr:carboxypeptidase regulatory-like domain-containing protein [Planctomycetota bacterium]
MIDFVSKMKGLPWLVVVAASLSSVVFVGCGKSTPEGTVQGKVTLDDAPYADATVVFLSLETGQAGSADIQSDGTFRVEAPLPVGTYVVYLAPKADEDMGEQPKPETIDQTVPDKYWDEGASDIKIEIHEGENDVPVPLKK